MNYRYETISAEALELARRCAKDMPTIEDAVLHIAGCMVENAVDGDNLDPVDDRERMIRLLLDYVQADDDQLDSVTRECVTLGLCERAYDQCLDWLREGGFDKLDAVTHPHSVLREEDNRNDIDTKDGLTPFEHLLRRSFDHTVGSATAYQYAVEALAVARTTEEQDAATERLQDVVSAQCERNFREGGDVGYENAKREYGG